MEGRMTAARRRVLLVEDEVLVSALAVDILDELSFDVVEAASAKAALAAAGSADARFDVAIIDVGLPDQRGDELAIKLRELRAELPIVIATGYGANALDKRLQATQRLVVIGKPYDSNSLMAALNKLGFN
jgi:DNA-binding response OmpR family regulator